MIRPRYILITSAIVLLALWATLSKEGPIALSKGGECDSGVNHALVIGISNYDRWSDLRSPSKDAEEIARILISLPEEKRRVAILCYMDGVSRKDVARLFDVPEATLRKRLHDTKKLLQKRIVDAAEKNLEEHLLPRDFASRCICACRRAMDARRREVISMSKYKKKCDCGCLPQAKAKGKKNT